MTSAAAPAPHQTAPCRAAPHWTAPVDGNATDRRMRYRPQARDAAPPPPSGPCPNPRPPPPCCGPYCSPSFTGPCARQCSVCSSSQAVAARRPGPKWPGAPRNTRPGAGRPRPPPAARRDAPRAPRSRPAPRPLPVPWGAAKGGRKPQGAQPPRPGGRHGHRTSARVRSGAGAVPTCAWSKPAQLAGTFCMRPRRTRQLHEGGTAPAGPRPGPRCKPQASRSSPGKQWGGLLHFAINFKPQASRSSPGSSGAAFCTLQ
jgi:hypothetical protein